MIEAARERWEPGPVASAWRDGIWLAAAAGALVLRLPALLVSSRIWAEEGSVYLTAALQRGAAMIPSPFLGYYSLVPNLAAWTASLLRPERMAAAMTAFSFAAQLVPAAVLGFTRHPAWDRPWKKAVLIAAFILLTDGTLHLSTTNSQYQLALAAALVLITMPGDGTGSGWGSALLLVLCCLASPQAPFLLPAFLYKAWRAPGRGSALQAGAVAVGLLLQGLAVLASASQPFVPPPGFRSDTPARWSIAHPLPVMVKDYLLMFWVNPFVSTDTRLPQPFRETQPALFELLTALALVGLVMLLAGAWRAGGWRRLAVQGFLLLSVLSMATSFGMMGAPRYAFPGHGLLAVLLVDAVAPVAAASPGWLRRATKITAGGLLVALLLLGGVRLRRDVSLFYEPEWPSWTEEIARAREVGDPLLKGWPYRDDWTIERALVEGGAAGASAN